MSRVLTNRRPTLLLKHFWLQRTVSFNNCAAQTNLPPALSIVVIRKQYNIQLAIDSPQNLSGCTEQSHSDAIQNTTRKQLSPSALSGYQSSLSQHWRCISYFYCRHADLFHFRSNSIFTANCTYSKPSAETATASSTLLASVNCRTRSIVTSIAGTERLTAWNLPREATARTSDMKMSGFIHIEQQNDRVGGVCVCVCV